VLDELSADPWGWKALRASMGSTFHVPVVRSRALSGLIDEWRRSGIQIAASVPRDGVSMYDVDFTKPTAILLGSEGSGLPADVTAAADTRVSIPMHGAIESLNAAVAAALLLYEARRQRS
jgi:TrmH family RNA methyltransferase